MNAETITEIIAADLAANPGFFNSHNVDVRTSLVIPTRLRCENSFREGEFLDLWLVLREHPAEESGYLIVFDETANEFGLAVYGAERRVFIGYYGSFTETLSAM